MLHNLTYTATCTVQALITAPCSHSQSKIYIYFVIFDDLHKQTYKSTFLDRDCPTEKLTNLRGGQALFGQLEDLLFDIIRCELQPLQVILNDYQESTYVQKLYMLSRCETEKRFCNTHSGNTAPVRQS